MKSCLYFSLLSSVMFTGSAFAACTPSPDCASLGYTETSCPNGGIKCPFDTSKWHCNECGADYKQDCTGTGYAGGAGTTCGGKYAYCNCASRYVWESGICKKTTAPSGYCCNDGSASGCSNSSAYSYCKQNTNYADCSAIQSSCISSGGTPRLLYCYSILDTYSGGAKFECAF